jgi:hypothetical protein
MVLVKTSVQINETLWKEWLIFCIKYKGKMRKTGEVLELAIEEYMKNHPQ